MLMANANQATKVPFLDCRRISSMAAVLAVMASSLRESMCTSVHDKRSISGM